MSTLSFPRLATPRYFTLFTILSLLLAAELRPADAATLHMKDRRDIQGTVDAAASDETVVVIRTADAVLKIPRAKIVSIEEGEPAAANAGSAAASAEQALLKQVEADLAKDPNNEALRKKVGEIRQSVLSRERLNYEGLFPKIDVLIINKKFDEAIAEADQMIARISDEGARNQCKRLKAQAHIGLARRFREFVDYPQEEANYKAAMEADPETPIAPLELADTLQISPARKADAITYYETGLNLTARHPGLIELDAQLVYLTKLAQLYVSEKRFAEAGDVYLSVMKNDKNMRHGQADSMALGAYDKIPLTGMDAKLRDHLIANIKSILEKKPRTQAAHLLLGRIYYEQKAWDAARDSLKLAVETAETGSAATVQEALYNLAICQHKLHENQDAITTFQKLLAMQGDHYDAFCELGDILLEEAGYPDALRVYEQALGIDADKVRAHLGKGTTLQRQGKYDDARKSYQDVLGRDTKNAVAQLAIARAWFEEKKYDETITEADKMIQMIRERYTEDEDQGDFGLRGAKPAGAATPEATPVAVAVAVTSATTATVAAANGATSLTVITANGATSATSATVVVAMAPLQPAAAPAAPKFDEDKVVRAKATAEEKALMAEANALIGKANLLSTPPKTNLARENFGTALKFVDRYAPAFEGLGLSFAADKLDAQAEENFNKAIAIDPQAPDFYLSFANYWMEPGRKKPANALPLYEKYQALGGKDPQAAVRIKEISGTPLKN